MIDKPFTLEELNEALGKIERPKIVYMNQKVYDRLLQSIDYVPTNVVVNNYLPDNQAIILPDNRYKEAKMWSHTFID